MRKEMEGERVQSTAKAEGRIADVFCCLTSRRSRIAFQLRFPSDGYCNGMIAKQNALRVRAGNQRYMVFVVHLAAVVECEKSLCATHHKTILLISNSMLGVCCIMFEIGCGPPIN